MLNERVKQFFTFAMGALLFMVIYFGPLFFIHDTHAANATTCQTVKGNVYCIVITQNGKTLSEVFPDSGEVVINIKHKE
jgi:hypothetical protein